MKADDIIWGGDHKAIVTLKTPILDMKEGDIVKIEYNYTTNKYELSFEGKVSEIKPLNKSSENELDLLRNGRSSINTVLSLDENECIIKLRIFEEIVTLGDLATFRIAITEDIKYQLEEKGKTLDYLENEFFYTDPKSNKKMIFVKGYGKKNGDFSILSRRKRLNVEKSGDVYIAESLKSYNSSYADFDAVYVIFGNIKFVDSTRDAKISAEISENMYKIHSSGKYFEIWNAYLVLEKIYLLQQAKEVGSVKYMSFDVQATNEGYKYIFTLEDGQFPNFPVDSVVDSFEKDIKCITIENISEVRTRKVGTFVKCENNECIFIDRASDSVNKNNILPTGFLFLSLAGDKVRMRRCEVARERIVNNNAEIERLMELIEDGTVIHHNIGDEKGITETFLKKISSLKGKIFNEEQKKAIDNAINTPDISLILGPPGTGKTTVIKAIVARFEDLFKKKNPNEMPQILISSFQHEAVDNAVIGMENEGLPPNRTGGKKKEGSNVSFYIDDWKEKKTKEISEKLDKSQVEKDEAIESFQGQFIAWTEKGKDFSEGVEILKQQLFDNMIKLSSEISNEVNSFIATIENSPKNSVLESIEDDDNLQRKNLLTSQRIFDVESFKDDGKRQARKLLNAIEIQGLFDITDTMPIKEVIETDGDDIEVFKRYVETVKALKEKYIQEDEGIQKKETNVSHQLEILLKRILGELRDKKIESLKDAQVAETQILKQYLDLIQDDEEIKKIISNYSSINAATCQQSMDIRKGSIEKKYDLVIIDEAARANPLDLMIPMSMGKKVILVGDHKQLPHMLSPEVVKEYRKNGKTDEMEILKKSLFERLFDMLESSGAKKRTARLSKQYRMNPAISDFASECFYKSNEENSKDIGLDSSEVNISEKQVNIGMYKNKPLVFLDMQIDKFGAEKSGISKYRPAEADFIMKEVAKALKKDSKKSIGIITFYRKQVDEIIECRKKYLTEEELSKVEIGSVDSFQGKEFDIVYLSCVRANRNDDLHKKVGFSNDKNRLCVSFTRARQLLVIVGDSETVSFIEEMKKFVELCKKGDVGYYELIEK